MIEAACFLHTELPVRMARLTLQLDALPHGLPMTPEVQAVRECYSASFYDLVSTPRPQTPELEKQFLAILKNVYARHTFGNGLAYAVQKLHQQEEGIDLQLQSFLNKFYTARLGIRILSAQYEELHTPREGWVGIIEERCSPAKHAQEVGQAVTSLCKGVYGVAPAIEVVGVTDGHFTLVPRLLRRILFALLKNSARATVERYGVDRPLPRIVVAISSGDEDVTVKVSDEGGGIPWSALSQLWSWYYTTAKQPVWFSPDAEQQRMTVENPVAYTPWDIAGTDDIGHGLSDCTRPEAADLFPLNAPKPKSLAEYGFGLPMSRVFARYFSGELTLIPMEGYGTDAYLYSHRLGDCDELLSEDTL